MPVIFPPDKARSGTGAESDVMRAIRANEEEALRSGDLSAEEAEAELDRLFAELNAQVAAGRIKP